MNCKNLQALTVINKCKKISSQRGIPKELITDNGTDFISHHFKKCSKGWDFKHQTVSPHYHQFTSTQNWEFESQYSNKISPNNSKKLVGDNAKTISNNQSPVVIFKKERKMIVQSTDPFHF